MKILGNELEIDVKCGNLSEAFEPERIDLENGILIGQVTYPLDLEEVEFENGAYAKQVVGEYILQVIVQLRMNAAYVADYEVADVNLDFNGLSGESHGLKQAAIVYIEERLDAAGGLIAEMWLD